ncbi:NifB/NifX family molybdenum-iron cluster-binding protein [Vibrio ziniensis]|uniref:Dinitrogenase iron-molybdenum cofactor biosynthesis domain-containing protein n=1 Tax=Vibrio ziniensis TaxID=2711221 RepID=A0A6G7CIJ1_9VIBR|nr:NifB/NifX family molybdenum-iron cluster-binding protein [Vibrio ziniensis]QIH41919.1 hypothetical protein G5S32_07930 [Vibrio ziniensis]
MKYAIPICNGKLFNHYSKSPQLLVIDDVTGQHETIEVLQPKINSTCGKKTQIMSLLSQQKVDAVIVKNIGEAMLSSLFHQGIKVFTIIRGAEVTTLDFSKLVPVTDISFARPSVNKQHKDHQCCKNKHAQLENKLAVRMNQLSPKTLSKLQRIYGIDR